MVRTGRSARARPRRVAPAALAWLVVWLLIGALAPPSARAWTEAVVRSVQARVTLSPDARAQVGLTLMVRVHGGWLEGIELAGLDPDLVLDESVQPWAVDGAGREFEPRCSVVSAGRIQVTFPGDSPRRGQVTLGLAYLTDLAHRSTEPLDGSDRVRVGWTLPGWRSGLDGVQIDVLAPPGSALGPRDATDTGASVRTEVREEGGHTVLSWRRAHLPRTVPWTVAADVPAEALAPELRGEPVVAPPPPPASSATPAPDPTRFWCAIAALIALMALSKPLAVARLARGGRSRPRPLLPLPSAVRVGVSLLGCAAGAWLACAGSTRAGIAALALACASAAHRPGVAPPPSRLGAWHPADGRWMRAARRAGRARRFGLATWLDATTWLGALHLGVWLSLPWVGPQALGPLLAPSLASSAASSPVSFESLLWISVLPLPVLATGTRQSFPLGPAVALDALARVARRLRALPPGVALRAAAHVDVRGQVQEARIRTVLSHRPEGLLRLDLAMGQRPNAGGWSTRPMLLVVTRAGSPAEAALRERLPMLEVRESRGGRRVMRAIAIQGRELPVLDAVVGAFEGIPAAPDRPRGAAAAQHTVRDLPAPRAVGW